jgi:hypothetical protein
MKSFEANREKRSVTVKFSAPPEDVFSLLCPVKEAYWVCDLENELIYSESRVNELGCIFRTNFNGMQMLSSTVKFDKGNYENEFLCQVSDVITNKVHIQLFKNEDNTTIANYEYTFTAISEKGNALVDGIDLYVEKTAKPRYAMLEYYLQNGKKMPMSNT